MSTIFYFAAGVAVGVICTVVLVINLTNRCTCMTQEEANED